MRGNTTNHPNKQERITRVCVCGATYETRQGRLDAGRGKFCSKACKYANASRPSGLAYVIIAPNPTRFTPVHGMVGTPTYRSWQGMKKRCRIDPHYTERGIAVCARWAGSFDAFLADMGERPEGRTLDRINNDGNYEPGNCRWATAKQQRANQSR